MYYVVSEIDSNRNRKAPSVFATPCRLAGKPVVAAPALPRAMIHKQAHGALVRHYGLARAVFKFAGQ
jgi:hypothetical protein